jgi:ATP-dependent Clp protease adapter protein ClpS
MHDLEEPDRRSPMCLQHIPFFGKFDAELASLIIRMSTNPLEQHDLEDEVITQEPAKVILFNDDVHSFDEVIVQLMKAVRCTQHKAEALAMEVHNNGKAVVFSGEILRCMEASHILEEIKLMTQIEV